MEEAAGFSSSVWRQAGRPGLLPCPRFMLTPWLLVRINHLFLMLSRVSFLSIVKHSGFDENCRVCPYFFHSS